MNYCFKIAPLILIPILISLCKCQEEPLSNQLGAQEAELSAPAPTEEGPREAPGDKEEEEAGRRRECRPILDLPSYLNASSRSSAGAPLAASNMSLSFQISDIEMPLNNDPTTSAASSALKLLSSFHSQFEPFDGASYGADSDGQRAQTESDELSIRFSENQLFVNGFNLSQLNIHLFNDDHVDSKFAIGILLKNTTLVGKFSYNGPTTFLLSGGESTLEAYYRLSIDNIYIVASSNLTKQHLLAPNNEHSHPGDERQGVNSGEFINLPNGTLNSSSNNNNKYTLLTNDFKLNITNLGYINIDIFDSRNSMLKPTSNYVLRILQRFLQKTIKRTYYTFENYIRQVLERESKRFLNCELTRFAPLLSINLTATAASDSSQLASSLKPNQSDLARILSNEIKRSQLSLVPLPDFEYQQTILASSARVLFSNGSLSGLNNLKLNGETKIKLQDNQYLFVNTSIGWFSLKTYYTWNLHLGSATQPANNSSAKPLTNGFVSFQINEIDFDAVIVKGLKPHTNITVENLTIRKLDGVKMDLSGLPGMNRVTRGMVNFFMSRLKQRLVASIQPALRAQLEKSLNKSYS